MPIAKSGASFEAIIKLLLSTVRSNSISIIGAEENVASEARVSKNKLLNLPVYYKARTGVCTPNFIISRNWWVNLQKGKSRAAKRFGVVCNSMSKGPSSTTSVAKNENVCIKLLWINLRSQLSTGTFQCPRVLCRSTAAFFSVHFINCWITLIEADETWIWRKIISLLISLTKCVVNSDVIYPKVFH